MLPNTSPLNTVPLNAVGGGTVSIMLFEDTMAAATSLAGFKAQVVTDQFAFTDVSTRLATRYALVEESLEYTDLLAFAQEVLVSESLLAADTATRQVGRMMAFAEALVLTDTVGSFRSALIVISDALALSDESEGVWVAIVQEALSLTDTAVGNITADLLETFATTTAVTNSVGFVMVYDDSLALDDSLAGVRAALMNFSDQVILGGVVNIDGTEYDAWVLNTETQGAWQYSNYLFNSFAPMGGKHYGCKEDGLYDLTGADDDGTDIDATVKTGLIDFGTSQLKRVPRAYLGFTASGDILFKTVNTSGGEKRETWQRLEVTPNAPTGEIIKLARGPKARYWQFEIRNIDGADFSIDDLKVFPVILNRRR